MPERKRKPVEKAETDLGLDGFENFFEDAPNTIDGAVPVIEDPVSAFSVEEAKAAEQIEKLTNRLGELMTMSVDQRVETAKITNQLIENQRQLIATQQILIRLMEKSIELTRHISSIEDRLPAIFELPKRIEDLRSRVARLEGVELS